MTEITPKKFATPPIEASELSHSFAARTKRYVNHIVNQNSFFSKLFALRGGGLMIGGAIMLLPTLAVSGTMLAVVAATSAIAGVVAGGYGLMRYGAEIIHDFKDGFNVHFRGKEPQPRAKKKRKPAKALWTRIGQTKTWNKISNSKTFKKINNSPLTKAIKNSSVWDTVSTIAKDQEIMMRTYATGGAVGTIVLTGTLLLTSAIALPTVAVSAATIVFGLAVNALVSSAIVAAVNVKELFHQSKNASKEGYKQNQIRKKRNLARESKLSSLSAKPTFDHVSNDNTKEGQKTKAQSPIIEKKHINGQK